MASFLAKSSRDRPKKKKKKKSQKVSFIIFPFSSRSIPAFMPSKQKIIIIIIIIKAQQPTLKKKKQHVRARNEGQLRPNIFALLYFGGLLYFLSHFPSQ